MQKENVTTVISESEFVSLMAAAKQNDHSALLRIIDLYKPDIEELSRFIYLPYEDTASEIIVEFLEFIHNEELENGRNGN
ncbi:helix-turn-helix domain-containing protein [Paenibacillus polysaccharolyticus]|uniref:helix-turn-helix domain-containing protein n=1 Tax=Paenibacillus polysaccharolyticus TaxID=582692 RepID=UPI00280BA554|nr:helix-turn-helix domain-containing protein [Paenibacillus polysaccharolyticus]